MMCLLMAMMDTREYYVYTPAEVARALRVNEETVRREIRRDQLGAVQVGRQYRITVPDLIAWLGQERYLELFRPHEALLTLLGSAGLDDEQAAAEATALVRRARSETTRQLEGEAPSPTEVLRRR
jgi:excisionase family DNA binding protein